MNVKLKMKLTKVMKMLRMIKELSYRTDINAKFAKASLKQNIALDTNKTTIMRQ